MKVALPIRSRTKSHGFLAVVLGVTSALVLVGGLSSPAFATGRTAKNDGGARQAAVQQCAQKLGITVGSKNAFVQLTAGQRASLKQCLAAAGVRVGGARSAALQQCAQKLGITVGSKGAFAQLTAGQRSSLKQCLRANRPVGTV